MRDYYIGTNYKVVEERLLSDRLMSASDQTATSPDVRVKSGNAAGSVSAGFAHERGKSSRANVGWLAIA